MLYQVIHQCFQTDRLVYTTSLVEALSADKALGVYNQLAAKHRAAYPYCWTQATIKDVSLAEVFRSDDAENRVQPKWRVMEELPQSQKSAIEKHINNHFKSKYDYNGPDIRVNLIQQSNIDNHLYEAYLAPQCQISYTIKFIAFFIGVGAVEGFRVI